MSVSHTTRVRGHWDEVTDVTIRRIYKKLVVEVKGRYPGSKLAVIYIESASEHIQTHHTLLYIWEA